MTSTDVAMVLRRRSPDGGFYAVSALLFAASVAATVAWCGSMSSMAEMPMPGGWTMSMAWMPMPGQSWPGAAASFAGTWTVMMVAMMLPSLVPMLSRYRRAVGESARLDLVTAVVGTAYFFVWTLLGLAVFPLGAALSTLEMEHASLSRAVPLAVGVVVAAAGALQVTGWKSRHLACCREMPACGRPLPPDGTTAWRHGLRLGVHCIQCCASLLALLLVLGVMDLRAMALVTGAITAERLVPSHERVARAIGGVVVATGLFLISRAAGRG